MTLYPAHVRTTPIEQARQIACKKFGEGSIPYNAVLMGQYDTGRLVQDALQSVLDGTAEIVDDNNPLTP